MLRKKMGDANEFYIFLVDTSQRFIKNFVKLKKNICLKQTLK